LAIDPGQAKRRPMTRLLSALATPGGPPGNKTKPDSFESDLPTADLCEVLPKTSERKGESGAGAAVKGGGVAIGQRRSEEDDGRQRMKQMVANRW